MQQMVDLVLCETFLHLNQNLLVLTCPLTIPINVVKSTSLTPKSRMKIRRDFSYSCSSIKYTSLFCPLVEKMAATHSGCRISCLLSYRVPLVQ